MSHATDQIDQLATALEQLRQGPQLQPVAMSRATGRAISTFSRDRATIEILDWKARDVFQIGRGVAAAGAPMVAYLTAQPIQAGDATAVPVDLMREVRATGAVQETIRAALADGTLKIHEIDAVVDALLARSRADGDLVRDLIAARRTAPR